MDFKDKQVAIIGAGVEGISTLKFLSKRNAKVSLLDQKEEGQLDPAILALAKSSGAKLVLGENYLASLDQYDIIFRTPGVRPDLTELTQAAAKGTQITSQTKYFFDHCPCPIVGITGTKGKGTTATLIYEILKRTGKKVFLGGNIGSPALDFLEQLGLNDLAVLELSSFQLIDLEKSPHVSIVLMITSEHLNWHKDTDEYIESKRPIVKYQSGKDYAVVNIDYPASKEFLELSKGQKIPVSTQEKVGKGVFIDQGVIYRNLNQVEKVMETNAVGLIGPHNLENIVAAVATASVLDISLESIITAVKEFKGLEHRLEFVREVGGVQYYNDSFSTTPETAIAAIKSFSDPEIVILGGSEKGSDYTELGKVLSQTNNVKALILIGQMGPKIKEAILAAEEFKGKFLEGAKSMEEIVSQAKSVATAGDIVLLSPACASFDMFSNYKDRGFQFKKIVSELS